VETNQILTECDWEGYIVIHRMAALTLTGTLAFAAAEIFGDVRAGDQYVALAPVQLVCGADTVRSKTDSTGSFRLASKAGGKCTFSITWQKSNVSLDVVVFDKPARYRLVLEQKDGAWILKRV
jgi:hypothetical protein